MIPEAAVEAAAIGIYRHTLGMDDWDSRSEVMKETVRGKARAALEAAAPHFASAWHDAVSETYVEGALSADQTNVMWNKNPYRTTP